MNSHSSHLPRLNYRCKIRCLHPHHSLSSLATSLSLTLTPTCYRCLPPSRCRRSSLSTSPVHPPFLLPCCSLLHLASPSSLPLTTPLLPLSLPHLALIGKRRDFCLVFQVCCGFVFGEAEIVISFGL